MITIQQLGPLDDPDPGGWREYEVFINMEAICRFKHKRSNGLGQCLLEAARAVTGARYKALANGAIPTEDRKEHNGSRPTDLV